MKNIEICKVQELITHGGSLRVWLCKKDQYQIDFSVKKVLQDEFESIKKELIEYRGPGYDINKDLEKFPIDELLRIMLIQEEGGHPF